MSETTKTIDDGGYAFPIPADDKAGWHAESGMTLRDWFAGQALSSVGSSWSDEETRVEFARRSYLMADAMIAARKGGSL
jgi:hypothetical protein